MVSPPLPHLGMDDTCGQNRTILGNWFVGKVSLIIIDPLFHGRFINHGGIDLLLEPLPPLVGPVGDDPYQGFF